MRQVFFGCINARYTDWTFHGSIYGQLIGLSSGEARPRQNLKTKTESIKPLFCQAVFQIVEHRIVGSITLKNTSEKHNRLKDTNRKTVKPFLRTTDVGL